MVDDMKKLWFEAKAEKTLESVNAAFKGEDIKFETFEEVLLAEKAGYIVFEDGIMKVYV